MFCLEIDSAVRTELIVCSINKTGLDKVLLAHLKTTKFKSLARGCYMILFSCFQKVKMHLVQRKTSIPLRIRKELYRVVCLYFIIRATVYGKKKCLKKIKEKKSYIFNNKREGKIYK